MSILCFQTLNSLFGVDEDVLKLKKKLFSTIIEYTTIKKSKMNGTNNIYKQGGCWGMSDIMGEPMLIFMHINISGILYIHRIILKSFLLINHDIYRKNKKM